MYAITLTFDDEWWERLQREYCWSGHSFRVTLGILTLVGYQRRGRIQRLARWKRVGLNRVILGAMAIGIDEIERVGWSNDMKAWTTARTRGWDRRE